MNFILLLAVTGAPWFPKTISMTTFDTKEHCEQALVEAKKQWGTVNNESYCIDLEKQAAIKTAKDKLKELENNK